jgi:methyl-accepting chemotaxis protein
MPGPADLVNAWQDAIKEVADSAKSLVSDSAGAASEIAKPLQQQAELLERVLKRQLEFERDVLSRIVEPARVTLELSEQAAAVFEEQASAFRAASKSLGELAELNERQGKLAEQASGAVKDALGVLRSAAEKISSDDEDK